MENKYHNIDEVFRHSLENYSADPPAYVWDNIDSALDKMDGKRKSRVMWFMGSFLAIATAFVGGYYLAGYPSGKDHQIAHPLQTGTRVRTVLLADASLQLSQVKSALTGNNNVSGSETSPTIVPVTDNREGGNTGGNRIVSPVSSGHTHNTVQHTTQHDKPLRDNHTTTVVKSVNTSEQNGNNLGQIDNSKVDKGYFSSGSSNINSKNTPKPVSNESQDSLKKNSPEDGSKPHSFNNRQSLNDQQKLQLVKELNMKSGVTQEQLSGTHETVKPFVPGSLTPDETEDISYLLPSYPIITVLPYFAPMYTLQNSSNDDALYGPAFGSDENFNEKPAFSWSSGVMLGYNFTKRLTVFVGCAYNQFSTTTNRENIQTIPMNQWGSDSTGEIYTSSGMIDGMLLNRPSIEGMTPYFNSETGMSSPLTRIRQTFGFVEVPVLVRYRFFGEKIGMTLTGGLSTGFLVRNDVYAENGSERVDAGSTASMRNFNLNAQLGVGLEVKILPWLYFDFEPTVRYSFLNWSTDPKVKMNPAFFSANTGLAFKF